MRLLQKDIGEDYTFPSHQLSDRLNSEQIKNMAASFQAVAVKVLLLKMKKAVAEFAPASVIIGGGVAANQLLREQMREHVTTSVDFIDPHYCFVAQALSRTRGKHHNSSDLVAPFCLIAYEFNSGVLSDCGV